MWKTKSGVTSCRYNASFYNSLVLAFIGSFVSSHGWESQSCAMSFRPAGLPRAFLARRVQRSWRRPACVYRGMSYSLLPHAGELFCWMGDSWLTVCLFVFPLSILHVSAPRLLAFKASDGTTANNVTEPPLYVTCCFSLAAFKVSLCLRLSTVWL